MLPRRLPGTLALPCVRRLPRNPIPRSRARALVAAAALSSPPPGRRGRDLGFGHPCLVPRVSSSPSFSRTPELATVVSVVQADALEAINSGFEEPSKS